MQLFFSAYTLARHVLACFAFSLAVAALCPVVHPSATTLVCGVGGAKWIVLDEGEVEHDKHVLECPICLGVMAPPPHVSLSLTQPAPLLAVVRLVSFARTALTTAPPMPSRGPPTA